VHFRETRAQLEVTLNTSVRVTTTNPAGVLPLTVAGVCTLDMIGHLVQDVVKLSEYGTDAVVFSRHVMVALSP